MSAKIDAFFGHYHADPARAARKTLRREISR